MSIRWILKREYMATKSLGFSYLFTRRKYNGNIYSAKTKFGKMYFRPDDSDISTLWYTLEKREYDIDQFPQGASVRAAYEAALSRGNIPLIIDAGANIGAASVWFSSRYPKARIVAVEPDPNSAKICRLNVSGRNVEVIEGAIGSQRGAVSIATTGQSWAAQTVNGGNIPMITIDDILQDNPKYTPIIAKIDIEGFESDLFSQSTEWIDRFAAIIIEPHDWMLPSKKTSRGFRNAIGDNFDMIILGENIAFVLEDDQIGDQILDNSK